MSQTSSTLQLSEIVSLCKRRGFIFQSSEIYGGLASTWDYGPLGVELKNNVKNSWWKTMVWGRDDVVGIDSSILMHPEVWKASGHVEGFTDPLVECTDCKRRYREDHISPTSTENTNSSDSPLVCPHCTGLLTEPRMFNLMFKTSIGPVEDKASEAFLRPETAQGIFVNFNNIVTTTRRKLPFGIAQTGKAFRNEITTGNFIFRTREFEIMEIEFFVDPDDADKWHKSWITDSQKWYTDLGVNPRKLRLREHAPNELAHYSTGTSDIEYLYPWGWGEISGIANRTDFDLRAHTDSSGESLSYFDDKTGKHIMPFVIEPTFGTDRAVMTFLVDAYSEEEILNGSGKKESRVVLKIHPSLAPVKVAVLPLSRNENLVPLAREVYETVRKSENITGMIQYDDAQSIGKRYRRQDEVGTPLCVTVDFDSLDDKAVTIRERDSMSQIRVPITNLTKELRNKLG